MATQKMKTRIVQKHDNSTNWGQATTFKPLDGEIIIYDDRPKEDSIGVNQKKLKLKIGDGITPVTNLSTIHLDWDEIDEKPSNFTPTSHGHNADEVKFTDGETFQKKFNDGELKGQTGAKGQSIAWGNLSNATAVSDTHATIASIIKNKTRLTVPVSNANSFKAKDIALLKGQYNDAPRQHYTMFYEVDVVRNGKNLEGYPLGVIEEGLPGAIGPAGKTPQKGTDYFTESDKQSFVNDVLTALPKWNWGSY